VISPDMQFRHMEVMVSSSNFYFMLVIFIFPYTETLRTYAGLANNRVGCTSMKNTQKKMHRQGENGRLDPVFADL